MLLLNILLCCAVIPLCITTAAKSSNDESHEEVKTVIVSVTHPYSQRRMQSTTTSKTPDVQKVTDIVRRKTLYCEPEEFRHSYIVWGNRAQNVTNKWKRARVGQRVSLQVVCLKPNGLPPTRRCLFDITSSTAKWENISHWPHVSCFNHTREKIISVRLNALHEDILEGKRSLDSVEQRRDVTYLVCKMLREREVKILPADVHYASQILTEVTDKEAEPTMSQGMVSIFDSLMSKEPEVLRASAELNATNAILETLEKYMDAISDKDLLLQRCAQPKNTNLFVDSKSNWDSVETLDFLESGVRAHLGKNFSVFYVNPRCANISGIAVYKARSGMRSNMQIEKRNKFFYRFVHLNESASEIMNEAGLEVATFVPSTLWDYLATKVKENGKEPIVVLKIYKNDTLFVERGLVRKHKPFSKVVSISIPGFEGNFPYDLPFFLRNQHLNLPSAKAVPSYGCGYWNYSTWINDGVQTNLSGQSPVIHCATNHLTQFSFLLGGGYKQEDISGKIVLTPFHAQALDIISLVGCSLSLLGLLGIWLTAAFISKWRSQASTKVLLHLCVALTLQMILFVFVNTDDTTERLVIEQNYAHCITLGAFMQYSLLVLFCWMLIVAILQFQRYVTVIGIQRPKHYILKSAILAWGLPLLPTLLVVFLAPNSYVPTQYQIQTDTGICYPSGRALLFGVITPVSVIIIANLAIFIHVLYSISYTLSKTMHRNERKMIVKQIRLSVLLFFLLGLSWIFAIFAFMKAGIVFSYLFCLTATLQGFVLFLYFVIFDNLPRHAWLKLLCPKRHKQMEMRQRKRETQSMNTTSTGLASGSQQ